MTGGFMENKDYIGAYTALGKIDGYKDSDKLMKSIKVDYEMALLEQAEVGEKVIFGTYEQDNDISDGKEDIEWIILEKKDGKAYLVSKYVLDNKKYGSVYWNASSIRKWLNNIYSMFLANSDK